MNQTWENGKKPSFGPDFGPFGPNPCCQNFFFKKLAPSVIRCHGQLSSCKISEKNNPEKTQWWMDDIRTDGQTTDQQGWFHRMLSNVQGPT